MCYGDSRFGLKDGFKIGLPAVFLSALRMSNQKFTSFTSDAKCEEFFCSLPQNTRHADSALVERDCTFSHISNHEGGFSPVLNPKHAPYGA